MAAQKGRNRPASRIGFDIAIICALPLEANAVLCSLEEVWDDDVRHQYGRTTGDSNHYAFGRSGSHAVVVVTLPQMGNVSSAGAATALGISFPSIKLALLVGICGAAPFTPGDNQQKEILLGDVVLSDELVRLDFGRQCPGGFVRKNTIHDVPGRLDQDILGLLQHLKTPVQLDKLHASMREQLARTMEHPQIDTGYPNVPDRLFAPDYIHRHRGGDCVRCGTPGDACDEALKFSCEDMACDEAFLVTRERMSDHGINSPAGQDASSHRIHFGAIGTSEMVMRSAAHRDRLVAAEGIIAFEMEGAGVWDNLKCLIIKGVCDYADSHKNKRWQGYAAAVAAATAVAVLAQYVAQDRPARFDDSSRMILAPRATDDSLTKEIFDRVVRDFETQLTPEQLQEFRGADLRGIKRELKSIQDEQERTRSLRNMRRIERFLVNMEGLGAVVQGILDLSPATELMGLVWGAARALLRTARGHTDLLDTLLSAYEQIGDELPVIGGNGEIFQHYVGFQRLLARIFLDVMVFHADALGLYSGRALKAVFRPLWQEFEPTFKSTLRRMRSYKTLIEDATPSAPGQEEATTQEIRHLLQQAEKDIFESQDQANRRQDTKLDALRDWIAAAETQAHHHDICRDRSQYPKSGDWILENEKVTGWLFPDPNKSTTSILWINGRPGTGKTYLASVLIEACMKNSEWTTCYFYCNEAAHLRASAIAILRGLLLQLLNRQRDLIPYCHAKMKGSLSPTLSDLSTACTLLEIFCERIPRLYVVIDGLDECEEGRKDVVETFKNLINKGETHSPGTLRVLFLSRPSPEIKNAIPEADVLALGPEHNKVDIERYCQQRSRELQKFNLPEADLTGAVKKICIRADGIFLFAKLVLNNLTRLPNSRRFDREIRDPRLPEELNSAYARIMDRLKQDLSKDQLEYTTLLLGWLVCSKRPMKWTEIQVALSIDLHAPGASNHLDVGLKLGDDVEELCGSLVQVLKGNRVELVHSTARHFIAEQSEINLAAAECDLTLRCLRYLTLDIFRREISDRELRAHALRGDLAFQDYAVSNWYLHVRTLIEMRQAFLEGSVCLSDQGPISPVLAVDRELDNFVRFYADSFPVSEVRESSRMDCVFFQQYSFYHLLVRVWDHICCAQRGDLAARNTVSIEPLQAALSRNRALLEQLSMDPSILNLSLLYDEFLFRCSKVLCFYFHEGFKSAGPRDNHVNYHDLPFHCPVESCTRYVMGFRSNPMLTAHLKRFHPEECDLGDSFTPLNRREVDLTRWQCDVCSRFFVRRNILEDHKRTHSGEKPFCCSECGRGFARKNDMRRHEKIHERKGR